MLADGGRAPSVLNGGLDNLYVLLALGNEIFTWLKHISSKEIRLGTVFAVGGVLEFELARRRKEAPEALQVKQHIRTVVP